MQIANQHLLLGVQILSVTPIDSVQSQDEHQIRSFQRKAEVNHEIQQLKTKMRDSQVLRSWLIYTSQRLAWIR